MEAWERPVVRQLTMPAGRLIVISDVHGDLPCLKALLGKLAPGEEDLILFLGDMVEKGPESLATLRYVMELCREGKAAALCGNCDNVHLLVCDRPRDDGALLRYGLGWQTRDWHPGCSLLCEMNREMGIRLTEETDVAAWKAALLRRFAPEFEFLRELPHVLETPDWRFVHGGLRPGPREQWTAFSLMKYDAFDTQGEAQDRWCVVGHWPVSLYRERNPDCSPWVNREKKILSIDGGRVLKDEGQLNALIIRGTEFSWVSEDLLPASRARDAQTASESGTAIRWTDRFVEVLGREDGLVHVRHLRTGREFLVPEALLWEEQDRMCCGDWTDYALPVAPGDELKVLYRTGRGLYCKKDGECGWYYGRLEEE